MRNKLVLFIVFLFSFAFLITPSLAQFSDVENDHQYKTSIEFLQGKNIIGGYPDGTYKPDKIINRAELLKIVVEAVYDDEFSSFSNEQCFSDVSPGIWFTKYVCFAKFKGIVNGYSDGSFKPEQEINYVEAIKIALETYGYVSSANNPSDPWYKIYTDFADNKNFKPSDVFAFEQFINRGQMAEIISRIIKFKEGNIDPIDPIDPIDSSNSYMSISVVDQNGASVSNADVKVYDKVTYSKIAAVSPIASGKTDAFGVSKINIDPASVGNLITVIATKANYVGSFVQNFSTSVPQKLILTAAPSAASLIIPKAPNASFDKIRIDMTKPIGTIIENEPYKVVFKALFDPSLLSKIQSVDANLVITNHSTEATADVLFQYKLENIKISDPQGFNLSLPQGKYAYYFFFDIHYVDGTNESYPEPYHPLTYYFENNYTTAGLAYDFVVIPQINYANCNPLFENQNSNDLNKVNLLFISIGEDQSLVKKLAVEFITGKFGIFSLEPFLSNQNKFQFWYSDKQINDLNDITALETIAYKLGTGELTTGTLPYAEKIKQSCYLPNRQIVYITKDPNLFGLKCADAYINIYSGRDELENCMKTESEDYCISKIPYAAVFSHEFGHQISNLSEEYTSDKVYDVPSYFGKYKQILGVSNDFGVQQTYYSPYVNPAEDCLREYGGEGSYYCVPNQQVVNDCKTNAPWKNLLGNGCGQDGVIDCDESDPDYGLEITCDNMGAGSVPFSTVLKPTKVSIMGSVNNFSALWSDQLLFDESCTLNGKITACDTSINSVSRLYGLVNEAQICKFINIFTGSTAGVCN